MMQKTSADTCVLRANKPMQRSMLRAFVRLSDLPTSFE